MRLRHSWLLLAGGALCTALGCSRSGRPASDGQHAHPYVVLVSFDAFRHDYIDRFHPAAFEGVAARGVRAAALIPSFPSKTFPNHYTLVTGVYPGHHGIVGNAFFDPARREWYRLNDQKAVRDSSWYGGEPIWVTAERNGVKTGVYFWPGSEAAIAGIRPSYLAAYDAKVPNVNRVNGTIAWLRRPAAERPHLVLLYFSEVDDTTHRYGPNGSQTAAAVASVDRALRQLRDSLAALPFADSVNIVLVSDHGMAQIRPEQVIPVSDLLARGGVDTTRMEVSDNGPTMSLWFGDSTRLRRAHAVLDATMPRAHTYFRSETPERWKIRDNPRAGDLLLVAEEGWILLRRGSDKAPTLGAHGYDPALPDMQGIFLAAGPNVKRLGTIPPFENVNVYPFLAALLQLDRVPVVDGGLGTLRDAVLRDH
jgi:predicted AlkP superfamily pyrophosphatase or phosphodiesterase